LVWCKQYKFQITFAYACSSENHFVRLVWCFALEQLKVKIEQTDMFVRHPSLYQTTTTPWDEHCMSNNMRVKHFVKGISIIWSVISSKVYPSYFMAGIVARINFAVQHFRTSKQSGLILAYNRCNPRNTVLLFLLTLGNLDF
jgi:hypothetical protein